MACYEEDNGSLTWYREEEEGSRRRNFGYASYAITWILSSDFASIIPPLWLRHLINSPHHCTLWTSTRSSYGNICYGRRNIFFAILRLYLQLEEFIIFGDDNQSFSSTQIFTQFFRKIYKNSENAYSVGKYIKYPKSRVHDK